MNYVDEQTKSLPPLPGGERGYHFDDGQVRHEPGAGAKQADDALEKRELIKGRVLPESSPMTSREAAEELARQTNSEVVQVIGSRFVLYRKKKKDPKIVLPR